jgi:CRISPR-associated endonuclease Csn1
MKYRLALDMGSTSLGWCVLALDKNNVPSSIINMGVRIFTDGRDDKTKEPLAVARRNARSLRRNNDRRDRRQKRLMSCLIQHGLMPENYHDRKKLESLDPYALRAVALDQEIPLHHLGRALFHINQRRGFKSNRKTDRRENEASNMKNAIKDLDQKIMFSGCRTLGEYLKKQKMESQPVRVRSSMVKNKAEYNFYPGREMYQKEVTALFEKQKAFHSGLTDNICAAITDIIFYQRPLKPAIIGSCRFESGEKRARLALPLVQKFRILQEVNNLQIDRLAEGDPALNPDDRKEIADALLGSKKKTFGQIRTLLKIPRDCRFNLESERRSELAGDLTSFLLSDEICFGKRWHSFTNEQQEVIINLLFDEPDPDTLIEKLATEWNVSPQQAENIANAPLPDGYGSVSTKAITKMMPFLEKGMKYSDAAKAAEYHHSDFRTGEIFDHLPYYGEILPNNVIGGSYASEDDKLPEKYFGKINNPTVHIALNQIRKLVNALIDTYGHPEQIVIELARELKEPAEDITKEQTKNQKDNERINKELELLGQRPNYRNRMVFKLWEDLAADPLKRCCPFSGIQISKSDIFTGQFEEEHLLPFSKSYNDGRANKVLSARAKNREKANRTPYEAFSHKPEWPEILARIQNLPKSKQWRFKEECWNIAKGQGEDIIARMLNDTRYMTKITKAYLSAVFDNEKGKSKIWAVPGQMTALLRDKWGLNDVLGEEDGQKDRTDHRHHAVDAFVIGCSDRSTFNRLSDAARKLEEDEKLRDKRHKLVTDLPEPFDGFRQQMTEKLEKMVISYKPDHGNATSAINAPRPYTIAGLHIDTAYGYIGKGEKKGTIIIATRKTIESMTDRKNIEKIADTSIRAALIKHLEGIKEGSAEWKETLVKFIQDTGTRRVRIHIEKTRDVLLPIKQPIDRGPEESRGQEYKLYELRGNYCAEIYCPDKGKSAGKWQCEIIPNYYAHQKYFIPQWRKDNPTAKLIMRLQIDDMVSYDDGEITQICRVKKMTNGMIYLRPHLIAKEQADKESWAASAAQLQLKNARKISVDILGRVKDPIRMKKKSEAA